MELLKIQSLNIKIDKTNSINNICISVHTGDIIHILDKNCCSHLFFEAIMGYPSVCATYRTGKQCRRPFSKTITAGKISIKGKQVSDRDFTWRNQLGYVGQYLPIVPEFTPEEIGDFFGKFYENWDKNYYQEMLFYFDLPLKKSFQTLSKGMKIKVRIAFELAHHPVILMLDNVLDGLDLVFRSELLDIAREIGKEELAILVSSMHEELFECQITGYGIIEDTSWNFYSKSQLPEGIALKYDLKSKISEFAVQPTRRMNT